MPGIDPNIPLSGITPKFNSPFETLGQIYQIRAQQQQLQTAQALEEQRRQQIQKQQQQEQDQQTLERLISANPDRPGLREAIRTQAPQFLDKFDASMAALDEKASIASKNLSDAKLAAASAGEKIQSYFAALGSEVAAHGNTPLALKAAGDHALATFPDSPEVKQRVEQTYQQVLQGTPIETITKGLIALNPTQAKQQNEAPGQIAESTVKGQVAAGTVGGITPQEQVVNAGAAASRAQAVAAAAETARHNRTDESIAAGHLALEGDKAKALAAIDITPEVETMKVGSTPDKPLRYLDLSKYQPAERAAARTQAEKAGIPVLSDAKQVAGLRAVDNASANLDGLFTSIRSALPANAADRLLQGPGNRLAQLGQFGPAGINAFNSWRQGAVQLVQALAEPGMGLRLNQAEIAQALKALPTISDTVGTAQQKIGTLQTMLTNKVKTALTADRQGASSTTSSSASTVRMTAPNGQAYDVPTDKVPAAKAQGWK